MLDFSGFNFRLHEESPILAEKTQSVLTHRRLAAKRCVQPQKITMKKTLVAISIIGLLIILVFIFVCNYIANAFGTNDKVYTQKELIENYNFNEFKISQLSQFYSSICPANKIVEIEFENDNTISRITISEKNKVDYQEWNFKIDSHIADSIFATIHWNKNTLRLLKEKLDEANCISISNNEPFEIGFKRSGLGMYSFLKFNKPMNDSLKKMFSNHCEFLIYNERVVFKYGGGAIGSDCFPENRK